jgi:CubicO group peptidase (beta-lactamase class C family)
MAFCCFNATARDYARLGHVLVHQGNWNGTQLLDSAWVSVATSPTSAAFYGHSFWLGEVADPVGSGPARRYVALRGHLGQWILAFPETGRVVVRLGRTEGVRPKGSWEPVPFRALAEEYAWK